MIDTADAPHRALLAEGKAKAKAKAKSKTTTKGSKKVATKKGKKAPATKTHECLTVAASTGVASVTPCVDTKELKFTISASGQLTSPICDPLNAKLCAHFVYNKPILEYKLNEIKSSPKKDKNGVVTKAAKIKQVKSFKATQDDFVSGKLLLGKDKCITIVSGQLTQGAISGTCTTFRAVYEVEKAKPAATKSVAPKAGKKSTGAKAKAKKKKGKLATKSKKATGKGKLTKVKTGKVQKKTKKL